MLKKIFKFRNSKCQKDVQKAVKLAEEKRYNYAADTFTCLYFPEILKEMEHRRKVDNFFASLIYEED